MQPTNQLLGVQFQAGICLVTDAVSYETLLISDFLSHRIILQLRLTRTLLINTTRIIYHNCITISFPICLSLNCGLNSLKINSIPEILSGSGGDIMKL